LGQERLGILVERLFAARSGPPRTTALEPSAASFDEQALESHPRWAARGSQGQVGRPAVTIRVPVDPGRRFAPASESLVAPCRREQDLPAEARDYLAAISDQLGIPIHLVGVGPGRDPVIWMGREAEPRLRAAA